MKIAVIGAGIVGMCTAYELVQDGHEVIVFERNASVAQEASFACAGSLSPSLSHPLAYPPPTSRSWLRNVTHASGVTLGKGFSVSDLRWLYRWKSADVAHAAALTTAHKLAAYSLDRLHAMALKESLSHEQSQGHLLLWKTDAAQAKYQEHLATLKECGLAVQALSPGEARALEPALQANYEFQSATYFPNDEIGNCRQFAHLLKEKLTQGGCQLRFGTAISEIDQSQGIQLITAIGSSEGVDQVVICAGAGSASLTRGNKPLPLTNLWSYSLSAPIRESLNAPRSAVQDMAHRMTISRMGGRVRVSGGAELGSRKQGDNADVVKQLYRTLNTLFPGAADFSRNAQLWKGASQFTPDGLPIIGPGSNPGVWFNLGHGHNGWSMACGSARLIADLVAGRQADLDTQTLSVQRFNS